MQQQDTTLDSIAGVVGTLKQQAAVMGHEVMEQVSYVSIILNIFWLSKSPHSMLGSLNEHVDRTDTRLNKAQKKMNDFIRENRSELKSLI